MSEDLHELSYESFVKKYNDEPELLECVHDDWIGSGPSTLVSEMLALIHETKQDKDIVLSQEAAMMACVESKRNHELQMIRKALYEIVDFSNSLISIEGIANILSRIEEKVES
jgi:hypothetical protein|tara:strand:- start:396 stop:734 length:339 start_codon:yes stop_codon:yes gene_type:complete